MDYLNYENITLSCQEVVVEDFEADIGGRLLRARENAGLTVDDVMFKTRLPRSVILGLEAGDFTVFSSPTYAKSFLTQYSEYLDVDAGIWLDLLEPSALAAGGDIAPPLWQDAGWSKIERKTAQTVTSGGWTSGLTFLTITCGVVFAATVAYKYFENLDSLSQPTPGPVSEEQKPQEAIAKPPQASSVPKAQVISEKDAEQDSAAKPEQEGGNPPADESGQKPPRAILVR